LPFGDISSPWTLKDLDMPQAGLMMELPLLLSGVLQHAEAQNGQVDVVSRETHGPLFRYTYADCAKRARQLANALAGLGLQAGDVVGSIAWNNHRHLESYYAVSGSGMVMHTCNPRLHPDQLIYIINHAEDKVVLFDTTFAPLVKTIAAHCPQVVAWVCLSDAASTAALEGIPHLHAYDTLVDQASDQFEWPEFDEHTAAALCYTSGTTGNPKGVMYSHRAIVLSAITCCMPSLLCLSPQETILPVVPMFHINAWCIPYAAFVGGAKLVLPGPKLDGASLYELMESEGVTISAGGAHDLASLVGACRTTQFALHQHAPHGGGRLGHAQGFDCQIHGGVSGGGAPRLGHDRNHGGGHHGHFVARHRQTSGRGAIRPLGQARQNRAWREHQTVG
jgi:3-(methylthio)propionyl---CoA ligase